MKIRIKGNSLRMRLTKTEVDEFGKTGYIEERTEFGDNMLVYALQSKQGLSQLEASFEAGKITMSVPEEMRTRWTTTEDVGYDHKMPIGNGKHLFLLLEKDWVCLDNTFEDQSDNYPNPNAAGS